MPRLPPAQRRAPLHRRALALAVAATLAAPASAQLLLAGVAAAPQDRAAAELVGGQFLLIVQDSHTSAPTAAALGQRSFRLE